MDNVNPNDSAPVAAAGEQTLTFPIQCPGLIASLNEWARWFLDTAPHDRTFFVAWLDCKASEFGNPDREKLQIVSRWLDGMWALDSVSQERGRV